MKIDTKITNDACFLRYNSAIPHESYWERSSSSLNAGHHGRQVMYEPTVILAPVLASKRQHEQEDSQPNKRRSLLWRDSVDSLIGSFESLCVHKRRFESDGRRDDDDGYNQIHHPETATQGRERLMVSTKRSRSSVTTSSGVPPPAPRASWRVPSTATAATTPFAFGQGMTSSESSFGRSMTVQASDDAAADARKRKFVRATRSSKTSRPYCS